MVHNLRFEVEGVVLISVGDLELNSAKLKCVTLKRQGNKTELTCAQTNLFESLKDGSIGVTG